MIYPPRAAKTNTNVAVTKPKLIDMHGPALVSKEFNRRANTELIGGPNLAHGKTYRILGI